MKTERGGPGVARGRRWMGLAVALAGVGTAVAAGPELRLEELKATEPLELEAALKSFALRPGFRMEVVAAEPLVRDPIDLCFDEAGRLFVVEMIDYSERRGETPHLGRVRRLEDVDGDGRYDRATVYVEDLPWPTAVFCYGGGVYVAATPDLWFCQDTDGDGRADRREQVFTGFGNAFAPYGIQQLNVQAMHNSLRWGLDNRIHGATGPNGGEVTRPAHPERPAVSLRGRDFVFDPRSRQLASEAGGGQYGMSFDDRGRRFTCSNSDHLRQFLQDGRYAARSAVLRMPAPLESIAVDGPSATVYRTSPEEPWRVIRTRWRVAGQVPGPIEGGGRASGYFTSATGLTVYRGDAWGEEHVGEVFVADCGSNLVHRKRLRPDGVTLRGERPADEQTREFLTSTDLWFRPVQLANGPDGNLYVVDMYREIIEHPWSLPPQLKQHLDLNRGNDRGRIYRVVREGYRPGRRPRLDRAGTRELVAALEHPNAWHRETAARLLYERQDRDRSVPALERLLRRSLSGLGRMHALWALEGQQALTPAHVERGLQDPDERVREHAVRLSERFLVTEPGRSVLTPQLVMLAGDAAPLVRYQLAFTLGELPAADRLPAWLALLRRDLDYPPVMWALLSSVGDLRGPVWSETWALRGRRGGPRLLTELVRLIGAGGVPAEVNAVIDRLTDSVEPELAYGLVQALGEGARAGGQAGSLPALSRWFDRAARDAADGSLAEPVRVRAVEVLGQDTYARAAEVLVKLLTPAQSEAVQRAVLGALGGYRETEVAGRVLARWAGLTPRLREEALPVLIARADRALALLDAVEQGRVRPSELTTNQRQFLVRHRESAVRERAERLLGSAGEPGRAEAVAAAQPALELRGAATRGRAIFEERCVSCHRLGGVGSALGPDLVSVRNNGPEKLLLGLVDPNRELLPQYTAYEVETQAEESLIGLVVNETSAAVTLRQPYGKETVIPRSQVVRMESQGRSIMPEGLEVGLDAQGLADLLAFLMEAP